MASLAEMPVELLLSIFYYIPPEDRDSLALISRRIRIAAAPIVDEHRVLKREYGTQKCASMSTNCATITAFLLQILRQPKLAFYVRRLIINGWHSEWNDAWNHSRRSADDVEIIRRQRDAWLPSDSLRDFEEGTYDGDEGSCLVLLLCLLPSLTTFTIVKDCSTSTYAFTLLQQTFMHNRENGCFARMTNVNLLSSDVQDDSTRISRSLDCIDAISSLGSIKTIKVKEFSQPDRPYRPFNRELKRPSQVTRLTFLKSMIGPKALIEFLPKYPLLSSFTYSSGWMGLYDARCINDDVYWICYALQTHVKATLQKLVLFARRGVCSACRFESFENLTFLETQVKVITGRENGSMRDTRIGLPSSIETLKLHANSKDDCENVHYVAETTLLDGKGHLPNLNNVSIIAPRGSRSFWPQNTKYPYFIPKQFRPRYEFASIVRECKRNGVKLIVERRGRWRDRTDVMDLPNGETDDYENDEDVDSDDTGSLEESSELDSSELDISEDNGSDEGGDY